MRPRKKPRALGCCLASSPLFRFPFPRSRPCPLVPPLASPSHASRWRPPYGAPASYVLASARSPPFCCRSPPFPAPSLGLNLVVGRARLVRFRCLAAGEDGGKKVSARLALTQQMLRDAEERAASAGSDPAPKITLEHVTVNFARSGGPGGQNVNKVNTKVDMRFNVKEAHWLGERIKERILQAEKNRINKDGELVISSTKTRTQKGNIEDALQKIQAIIDAASYVPPPPTEEQKKKIEKIAAVAERKRLQNKKVVSQKKEFRRNRTRWD